MNKVKVAIAGKDYVLQTTEDERYVMNLAKVFDHKINELMEASESLSLTTASLLVGLDILDEATKINTDIDNLRFQVKDYIDEATKANARVRELEKKVEVLEKENKELWHEIEISSEKGNE